MSEPDKPNKNCEICKEKITRVQGCEHGSCWYCELKCCQQCCSDNNDLLYEKKEVLFNGYEE